MSSLAETALIDRATPQVRPAAGAALSAAGGRRALAVLTMLLPFEWRLVEAPGVMTVTSVEVVAGVAVAVGVAAIVWCRIPLQWPRWATAGASLLAVFAAAAVLAPADQGNAIRLVGRLSLAAAIVVVTATLVDREEHARRLAQVLLGTAAIVGTIAVLEVLQEPSITGLLTVFRPGSHLVAGQLRATSTLMYPTIASMYLEVAFAVGLWLLLERERGRASRVWTFGALVAISAGITATFTRAGLIGIAVAIVTTGLVVHVRGRFDWRQGRLLTGLVTAVVASIFILHSPERLAARVSTEGSQAWYGVAYAVPSTLSLRTGGVHRVPVSLTNTGRLTWDSTREPRFMLSYHWLRADSEVVVQFEGQRTPFAASIAPGATVSMLADVTAPALPGRYTLVWDVVHERRAWLSTEGVSPARTAVRVEGAPVTAMPTRLTRLPQGPARPDRPALWRAGLAMAADRPLLGVGPDNFRHTYGAYLGLADADSRVHANNMYLEALTGAGVPGLVTLVWLFAASGRALVRRCRTASSSSILPAAALLSAWLMVAGHGLVDSFVSFTTTYLTFALVAGVAFARAWEPRPAPPAAPALPARYAHRV